MFLDCISACVHSHGIGTISPPDLGHAIKECLDIQPAYPDSQMKHAWPMMRYKNFWETFTGFAVCMNVPHFILSAWHKFLCQGCTRPEVKTSVRHIQYVDAHRWAQSRWKLSMTAREWQARTMQTDFPFALWAIMDKSVFIVISDKIFGNLIIH